MADPGTTSVSWALRLWKPVKAVGVWIAEAWRTPRRVVELQAAQRELEAARKRDDLRREPYRPSVVACGIRWARSNIGAHNELHCEMCYQDRGALIPLSVWQGANEKHRFTTFRCTHQSHAPAGQFPHFVIWEADYNLCRAMPIPDRSADA